MLGEDQRQVDAASLISWGPRSRVGTTERGWRVGR